MPGHISSAKPASAQLTDLIRSLNFDHQIHFDKTYVCVEGPRLGTQAESFMFRKLGFDCVGMTAVPEVFLAREACLSYLTIAIVTDYDCWKEEELEHVSVEQVLKTYRANIDVVKKLLLEIVSKAPDEPEALASKALSAAIICDREKLSDGKKKQLQFLESY